MLVQMMNNKPTKDDNTSTVCVCGIVTVRGVHRTLDLDSEFVHDE